MVSTLYPEPFSPADSSRKPPKGRKFGLDEIAVFALVVVALFYIAAASCWFIM